MKTVMILFVIFLVTLSFPACEKANNPVTPASIDKTDQAYYGTFQVTYKDYKNASKTVSVSGNISFNFNSDNTYSYNAAVDSSANSQVSAALHDQGAYKIRGNTIEMSDNAAKLMNLAWQPSLYLSGTYSYRSGDSQITIEGSGDYGSVRIVLNNQ